MIDNIFILFEILKLIIVCRGRIFGKRYGDVTARVVRLPGEGVKKIFSIRCIVSRAFTVDAYTIVVE